MKYTSEKENRKCTHKSVTSLVDSYEDNSLLCTALYFTIIPYPTELRHFHYVHVTILRLLTVM